MREQCMTCIRTGHDEVHEHEVVGYIPAIHTVRIHSDTIVTIFRFEASASEVSQHSIIETKHRHMVNITIFIVVSMTCSAILLLGKDKGMFFLKLVFKFF
jgi:hypothetical protein